MAYAQNTITDPNASNVFATEVETLLAAAGWTRVESLVPSGTFKANVWKSSGASNLCGYDWYLSIQWNTVGTTECTVIIAGTAYDLPSHTISGIPAWLYPSGGGVNASPPGWNEPVTGNGWPGVMINAAPTADTSANGHPNSYGNNAPWLQNVVPSAAFAYWISITKDHVSIFTTTPGLFYHASSLAIDAGWPAAWPNVYGHPIIAVSNGGSPNRGKGGAGISATVIGQGSSQGNNRYGDANLTPNIGTPLPSLNGNYLPAYAWKDAAYLNGYYGAGGAPLYDSPQFGEPIKIGDAIDWYRVYGGSIGDTITIGGATYVLSGPLSQYVSPADASYIAVLVE